MHLQCAEVPLQVEELATDTLPARDTLGVDLVRQHRDVAHDLRPPPSSAHCSCSSGGRWTPLPCQADVRRPDAERCTPMERRRCSVPRPSWALFLLLVRPRRRRMELTPPMGARDEGQARRARELSVFGVPQMRGDHTLNARHGGGE